MPVEDIFTGGSDWANAGADRRRKVVNRMDFIENYPDRR